MLEDLHRVIGNGSGGGAGTTPGVVFEGNLGHKPRVPGKYDNTVTYLVGFSPTVTSSAKCTKRKEQPHQNNDKNQIVCFAVNHFLLSLLFSPSLFSRH